jgi:transposase
VVPASRGVSARARLEALLAGPREVTALAARARGRLRATRAHLEEAVPGDFTPQHSCLLTAYFRQVDGWDGAIDRVSAVLAQSLAAEPEASARLDPSPGVSQRPAQSRRAASGTAMARLPSAKPLASWAGMGPGHDASGGQRRRGKTRTGRRW